MILFNATSRRACALSDDKLTTGSVGIQVEFTFSDDWTAAPSRIAVFRGSGVSVDVALLEDSCTVPPEVLTQPGSTLTIGVYGTDGTGTVVIPTVYAEAGQIKRGAEPSGVEPTPQTQPLIAQLLAAAQAARNAADEAERLAQSIRDDADNGEFDGQNGAPGNSLWWTVSLIDDESMAGQVYGKILSSWLKGRSGVPAVHDLVVGPAVGTSRSIGWLYEIIAVSGIYCNLHGVGSIKGAPGDPGADGYAPEVTIEQIDGGHRVTITSADYPEGQSFDVINGAQGPQGETGPVGPQGPGVTEDLRAALLQLAQKVAYVDEHGADYYQDIYDALYPSAALLSISATFTQGSTVVYENADLDSLRPMLYVVGHYDDNTDAEVTTYSLSGYLTAGTSTVTVAYQGKTTTFTVTVTAAPTLFSISAVYTQSGTVYTTDTLDSLKTDLVVTATYSDSSTATVAAADYTLSGTLTAGTSTITASYGGKTATFTVTVTAASLLPTEYQQVEYIENPNGAYITTSVNFPAKFEAYVKSQTGSAPTGNAKIVLGGKGYYNYGLVTYSTTSLYVGAFCYNNNTFVQLTDLYDFPAETTVTVDTVNNTVVFDATNASANASKTGASIGDITSVAIRVFWYGAANQQFVGKIFEVSVKNTETNADVLHLYPCYRKSDNKVGMYDTVNSQFYTSETSTDFIKGADVA